MIHIILKVIQLENGVVEYRTDKAIVRIHPDKRTKEERKAVLENAAKEFYKSIQKSAKA